MTNNRATTYDHSRGYEVRTHTPQQVLEALTRTVAQRHKYSRVWFPEANDGQGEWRACARWWKLGWSRELRRWVATNGESNARWFRSERDLRAYAQRMLDEWHWNPGAPR
jgi:hypothetical protein